MGELSHFGVKGMEWGKKKLRDIGDNLTDISETELKHYGRLGMKWYQRIFTSGDRGSTASTNRARALARDPKALSEMSDAEIRDLTNRLNMERQIRDVYGKTSPGAVKRTLDGIKKRVGETLVREISDRSTTYFLKKMDEKLAARAAKKAADLASKGMEVPPQLKNMVEKLSKMKLNK